MINTIDRLLARLEKREKNLWITNMKYKSGDLTSQIWVWETTNNSTEFQQLTQNGSILGGGQR